MLKIDRHHDEELSRRLEQVLLLGVARIHNTELQHWYNKQRVARNVWIDLDERMTAIAKNSRWGPEHRVYVFQVYDEYYLIWGEFKKWGSLAQYAAGERGEASADD